MPNSTLFRVLAQACLCLKYRTGDSVYLLYIILFKASVESYVTDVIREQVTRRQAMDNGSRNLLRLMTATAGYADVRAMAMQRLEMWLANPKVSEN